MAAVTLTASGCFDLCVAIAGVLALGCFLTIPVYIRHGVKHTRWLIIPFILAMLGWVLAGGFFTLSRVWLGPVTNGAFIPSVTNIQLMLVAGYGGLIAGAGMVLTSGITWLLCKNADQKMKFPNVNVRVLEFFRVFCTLNLVVGILFLVGGGILVGLVHLDPHLPVTNLTTPHHIHDLMLTTRLKLM